MNHYIVLQKVIQFSSYINHFLIWIVITTININYQAINFCFSNYYTYKCKINTKIMFLF